MPVYDFQLKMIFHSHNFHLNFRIIQQLSKTNQYKDSNYNKEVKFSFQKVKINLKQMQRTASGKNKISTSRTSMSINSSHLDQYQNLTSPRKKISQQSIQQFKIQIDHQIAKCLDTLDRQGLKFLRQTLKTSNLFNSANLQIDEESIKYEKKEPEHKVKSYAQKTQFQTLKNDNTNYSHSKKPSVKDEKNKVQRSSSRNRIQSKKYNSNSSFRVNELEKVQKVENTTNRKKQEEKPPQQSIKDTKNRQQIKPTQKIEELTKNKKSDSVKRLTVQHKEQKDIKVRPNSKASTKIIIQNKKTHEKISLGQKINKKMEQLHISKVGPAKNDKHKTSKKPEIINKNTKASQKVQHPEEMIEEDIIQGADQQIQNQIEETHSDLLDECQNKKVNNPSALIEESINDVSVEEQSVRNQPQQQVSVKISQKSNPLRPFKKDKLQYISALNRAEENGTFIQSQTQKKQLKQVQKLSYSIQVNESKFQGGSFENQVNKNNSAQMSMIVEKINKLSPNKLLQVQKYLEYIEKADSNQNNHSQVQKEKETHQQQFEQFTQQRISNPVQIPRNSQVIDEIEQTTRKSKIPFLIYQNDSSKKLNKQKKQKASLIYNGNLKSASRSRIKIDVQLQDDKGKEIPNKSVINNYNSSTVNDSPIPPLNNKSRYQSQIPKISETIILNEQKPLKMEKIDFSESKESKSSISQNNTSKVQIQSNVKKPQMKKKPSGSVQQKEQEIVQNESIVSSSRLNIQYTQVKMLNLNVKKSQVRNKIQPKTILKFKILSNRGHSSLFGLTGIQLFTIQGKRVIVSEKDLQPNILSKVKILNLFNSNHLTTQQENIYQSSMTKNEITVNLDKQNEKIGGIVIFNFNKSFLESNKEVDEMQIYHNDDKVWKGTINHGSYDQFTNYGTYVQFMPGFKFPEIKKRIFEQDKIQVRKQEKTSLWIQNTQQNPITIMKQQEITKNNSFKSFSRNQTKPQQAQYNEKSISDLKISQPIKSPKQQHFSQVRNQENQVNYRTEANKKIDIEDKFSEIRNSNRIPQSKIQTKHFASKNTSRNQKNDYDEFDTMLKGLEQNINREKSKSKITPVTVFEQNPKQQLDLSSNYQNKYQQQKSLPRNVSKNQVLDVKQTKNDRKNQMDDFMNDSLFHQKPQYSRIPSEKRKLQPPTQQKIQEATFEKKKEPIKQRQQRKEDINIDDFLGQLQNVMGNKMTIANKKIKAEKSFAIPNLPQGQQVQLQIFQNWGHQAIVGIQGIQFFDEQGNNILPTSINCNKNLQNIDLLKTLNANNIRNRDQKMLTKVGYDKGNSTIFTFSFTSNRIFSLIRIWNYNGHRVHSNIGIKYCLLKINQSKIFMGELRKNQSTPENFHKQFQTILLTNDLKIINKIKDKDWLTELKNKLKQQKQLFKSTLMNFNRPKTRNTNEGTPLKRKQEEIQKILTKQIKLPKRACWEYEPPEFPQGKVLVFLLHDTWGDKNFIGLNGIQIFDNFGNLITKDKISKIKAFPSSTGQSNQKRIVQNLINGFNFTTLDTNIWLSTYQSDLQKLQTGKPNTVILQLHKSMKLSGINIYNYSKTPERGVREIQIQIDSMIAFRGYVKMYDQSNAENSVHTTINFTKDLDLLTKMNYEGYNQDNIDQNVNHVNEKKVVKV